MQLPTMCNSVDAYNKMIDVADDYSVNDSADATRLLRDISSITKGSQSKLSYIGLMTDDDGKLTIDRDILAGALSRTELMTPSTLLQH